jgi:hypothetical protein
MIYLDVLKITRAMKKYPTNRNSISSCLMGYFPSFRMRLYVRGAMHPTLHGTIV